jgi:hypothetical protein
MKKLTINELKRVIKQAGFKIIYNSEDKEYYLIAEYYKICKPERVIK